MEEEDIKPDVFNLDASTSLTNNECNSDVDIKIENEHFDDDDDDQFYELALSNEKIKISKMIDFKDGVSSPEMLTQGDYSTFNKDLIEENSLFSCDVSGESFSLSTHLNTHKIDHMKGNAHRMNRYKSRIMDVINSEELISAVEIHPAVWDTSCTEYRNKQMRMDAWMEICEDVVEDFADIQDDLTKIDICKKIQLKWKSMRDSFRKDHNYNILAPTGSKKRKYLYANQLRFLLKTMEGGKTDSSTTQPISDEQEDSDIPFKPIVFKKAKRQKSLDLPTFQYPNKVDKFKADETGLFFQSLLSSVKDFTEDEKLQLKGGVISLITNIRRARNNVSQSNGFQRSNATTICSNNAPSNTASKLQPTQSFTDFNSDPLSVSSVSSDGNLNDI